MRRAGVTAGLACAAMLAVAAARISPAYAQQEPEPPQEPEPEPPEEPGPPEDQEPPEGDGDGNGDGDGDGNGDGDGDGDDQDPSERNPKFEFGKAGELEKVKDVEWSVLAHAGFVATAGNSETISISAGLRAARKTGKNKLAAEGSVTYARAALRVLDDMNGNGLVDNEDEILTQTTITAETLASKLRYDRFLTRSGSVFVAALASRDLPAGKEAVLGAQVGYSRRLYKTKRHEAVAELGYDLSREDLVVGDPVAIHSARAFGGYKGVLITGTSLEASAELLTNLFEVTLPTGKDGRIGRDTRLNARVAIASKLGKHLAIQTSLELRYDHRPGPLRIKHLAPGFVPEAAPLDTIMKASLIYTFL
jgi:Protein of unknown function, DUF481